MDRRRARLPLRHAEVLPHRPRAPGHPHRSPPCSRPPCGRPAGRPHGHQLIPHDDHRGPPSTRTPHATSPSQSLKRNRHFTAE